jgi:hypothetical protein
MKNPSGDVLIAWDEVKQAEVFIQTAPAWLKDAPEISAWFQIEFERASSANDPDLTGVPDMLMGSEIGPCLVIKRPTGISLQGLVPLKIPLPAALHILIKCSHRLIAAAATGAVPFQLFPEQIMVAPDGAVNVVIFGCDTPVDQREDTLCTAFATRALELLSGQLLDGPVTSGMESSILESGAGKALHPSMTSVFERAFASEQQVRFSSLHRFMDMLIAAAPLSDDQRLALLELMDSEEALSGDPIIAAVVPPESEWKEQLPKNVLVAPDPKSTIRAAEIPAPRKSSTTLVAAAVALTVALGVGGVAVFRRPAPLTIQTEPIGADIRVDGRLLGKAPLGPTRDIKPGMVVQIDSPGYLPNRYTVKEGDSLVNLKLEPIPPPAGEVKAPSAHELATEPLSESSPSSKVSAPKPKAKPKAPPAPKGKKGNVFDQFRTQM